MKQLISVAMLWLCLLIGATTFAQANDSTSISPIPAQADATTQNNLPAESEVDDDFAPGLAVFAIGAIGFALFCVGAGIAVSFICMLAIFALVSVGIVSTSVVVALHKKSLAKGIKVFVMLVATVCGIMFGAVVAFVFNQIVHWWPVSIAVITGAIAGLVAGPLTGLLAFGIGQRMVAVFKEKLALPTIGKNTPTL